MIFNLIGSLGLFLLGMWLMTEGLKLAGGRALETLLGTWTSTRLRGLSSGILITALVQSSSAVTIATLGFVSAGLMQFQQAIWVVFGSNVGTTFTAWIVTLFGFSLKINAITFPLIGLGAGLRLFSPYDRGRALGMALAGFGLLFMGIDALNNNFSTYAQHINIEQLLADSSYTSLWALGIGFILTLLTQSSSAAIAIILTAVASGVAGIHVAAAAVIGANIGTTSTAVIASIGATANAKRLALAHVAFNLLTATVALLLLPAFWTLTSTIASAAGMGDNPIIMLAIFHTCFNVLGVILMWPIEPKLSKKLLSLYTSKETTLASRTHLDTSVVTIPDLAIRSIEVELHALLEAIDRLTLPINSHIVTASKEDVLAIEQRLDAANDFIALSLKSELTEAQGSQLTLGLSISHHLKNACKTFSDTVKKYRSIAGSPYAAPQPLIQWFEMVNDFNHVIHHSDDIFQQEKLSELSKQYLSIKAQLFESAVNEKLNIKTVDIALQAASLSRRFIEQIAQANVAYHTLSHSEKKEKNLDDEDSQSATVKPIEAEQPVFVNND